MDGPSSADSRVIVDGSLSPSRLARSEGGPSNIGADNSDSFAPYKRDRIHRYGQSLETALRLTTPKLAVAKDFESLKFDGHIGANNDGTILFPDSNPERVFDAYRGRRIPFEALLPPTTLGNIIARQQANLTEGREQGIRTEQLLVGDCGIVDWPDSGLPDASRFTRDVAPMILSRYVDSLRSRVTLAVQANVRLAALVVGFDGMLEWDDLPANFATPSTIPNALDTNSSLRRPDVELVRQAARRGRQRREAAALAQLVGANAQPQNLSQSDEDEVIQMLDADEWKPIELVATKRRLEALQPKLEGSSGPSASNSSLPQPQPVNQPALVQYKSQGVQTRSTELAPRPPRSVPREALQLGSQGNGFGAHRGWTTRFAKDTEIDLLGSVLETIADHIPKASPLRQLTWVWKDLDAGEVVGAVELGESIGFYLGSRARYTNQMREFQGAEGTDLELLLKPLASVLGIRTKQGQPAGQRDLLTREDYLTAITTFKQSLGDQCREILSLMGVLSREKDLAELITQVRAFPWDFHLNKLTLLMEHLLDVDIDERRWTQVFGTDYREFLARVQNSWD